MTGAVQDFAGQPFFFKWGCVYITEMKELLDAFNELDYSKGQQVERTYLQILGYPHYENVCSNLLCFFFDTEETHGFSDLFVRSLLECTPQASIIKRHKTEYVDRECTTAINNRVDIVLETETLIIGIENKIYSEIYNDLNDYESYIKKRAMDSDKEPVCILLSMKNNAKATDTTGFYNITYPVFVEKLQQNLGQYILMANTKWIVFFNDVIRTLTDIQGGVKMEISKEILDFFSDNWNSIDELLNAKIEIEHFLKSKAKTIKELVSVSDKYPVKENMQDNKTCCFEYYVEIENSKHTGGTIILDILFDCDAFYLLIGVDDDSSDQKKMLIDFLENNNLAHCQYSFNDLYFQLEKFEVFEYEAVIADKFIELLNIVMN